MAATSRSSRRPSRGCSRTPPKKQTGRTGAAGGGAASDDAQMAHWREIADLPAKDEKEG